MYEYASHSVAATATMFPVDDYTRSQSCALISPGYPQGPVMIPDATEQMVQAITQKMRETYVQLGKSIIPLLTNTSEDIKTLLELGEVYENLGCVQEAITTYEHARLLNQECLPESARMYLESHPDPQP